MKKGCSYALYGADKKLKSIIVVMFEHANNKLWKGWKHWEHCASCFGTKHQQKKKGK
jgi:hypothetical protein